MRFLMIGITMFSLVMLASPNDPYNLHHPRKNKYVKQIILEAHKRNVDPVEALAVAITESALDPTAYSHTKDVGLFQVNCKWWYKRFKYKSIRECEKNLLMPTKNIKAGLFILKYFRENFKQCAGTLAYRCYNGGQRWKRSKNKHKIIKYSGSVRRRKKIIDKHYGDYIYHYTRSIING